MQEHDLLSSGTLLGMTDTQKKAERIITALENPINDQVLTVWINRLLLKPLGGGDASLPDILRALHRRGFLKR